MRFIGNKENLVETIYYHLSARGIKGNSFFDAFSGTASVAKFFKKKNYKVFSSDVLYFSYVLQKAYIENNQTAEFVCLLDSLKKTFNNKNKMLFTPLDTVLEHLNNITPQKGFIYKNYSPSGTIDLNIPRMYFSDENAQRIDAIRNRIELWKEEEKITPMEYYILLSCLIETVSFYANTSGIYAAFHKTWDPRAIKKLEMKKINLVLNKQTNKAFNSNFMEIVENIDIDILYLDPPYNQRQYAPNYHLLETIAKYDSPEIKGVTGMRDYSKQKSNFCNKLKALEELKKIASKAKYINLILSYNSEGIMPKESILEILTQYGKVEMVEFDYCRYKSNNNGLSKIKKMVKEQLYLVKKK